MRKKISFFLLWFCLLFLTGCGAGETAGRLPDAVSPDVGYGASGTLTAAFLDVGQGNAVLFEQGGRYLLVDGGDRDAASFVVSYLKGRGVKKLEYVIASHYDSDHISGLVGVLNAFECGMLLDADYEADSKIYRSFATAVESGDIKEHHPEIGDTYQFGDAEFTIVCPDAYDYDDENDNSIGIRLTYGENSFLLCGDAGKWPEEMMRYSGLAIQSDVYLASHHGSKYASTEAFYQMVSPSAVVISAGLSNDYGHPTERVLKEVRESGADLYRTDLQGTIVVESDGKTLTFNVKPCEDYRSGEELKGAGVVKDAAEGQAKEFVLNTGTKKFHMPDCDSVAEMKEKNKALFTGTREELIDSGYEPCKKCRP